MLAALRMAFEPWPSNTHAELRRSGAMALAFAALWFAAFIALMFAQFSLKFLPQEYIFALSLLPLPAMLIWCVGMHRVLWGQRHGTPWLKRIMMTIASTVVGFCTFMLLAGITGAVVGFLISPLVRAGR